MIGDIQFTTAALENIRETGICPDDDVAALRSGAHTRASLLAHCLDGADPDRERGWHDYVVAVCDVADYSEEPCLLGAYSHGEEP